MAKAVKPAEQPKATEPDAVVGDPLTKSKYATAMANRWLLADSLMGGSEAMRNRGTELLPRHENEGTKTYENRVEQSFLLPVFAQSVRTLADIVFGEPINWDEDLSTEQEAQLETVDGEGNPIDVFAKRAFSLALAKGEVYIFADEAQVSPEANGNVITLADKRKQGVKPYLAMVSADNMLAYEIETRGGVQTCTYARWTESETRQGLAFEEETVDRVIEWRPGDWTKYERVDGGRWTKTAGPLNYRVAGKPALPIIRFRIGDVDSYGAMLPPLHGLAEKNVEHWQSSSNQRAILTVSRFPMLGGSGVDIDSLEGDAEGGVKIGPNVTLFAKDPQSEYYYVEPSGTSIEMGAKDLEHLETDMSQLAFQPLMRQQAGVTATKDALGESKANSSLASWSIDFCIALDRAVAMLANWAGETPAETNFSLNVEFGIDTIDATQVTAIQAMRVAGDLGRKSYLAEMVRLRVLSEEFDAEANEEELNSEGPPTGNTGDPNAPPDDPNAPPPEPTE